MSTKGEDINISQDSGIVYCATGKELFLEELFVSLEYIKKYNKNFAISIFTEEKFLHNIQKVKVNSIHLIEKPQYSFGDKIYSIRNSPYKKTLYLDCDIVVADNISEVFNVLDKFDLAIAHIPYKNRKINNPNSPLFNGGVIAVKKNEVTDLFLEKWDIKYKLKNISNDQVTLREVIDTTKIPFFILPQEYNFRLPFSMFVRNKVKLFHGHEIMKLEIKKIEFIIKYINRREEERVWFPNRGILYLKDETNLVSRLLNLIETRLLKKLKRRFWDTTLIISIKNKLWQYYLPFLINWVIPIQYRRQMEHYHKELIKIGDN